MATGAQGEKGHCYRCEKFCDETYATIMDQTRAGGWRRECTPCMEKAAQEAWLADPDTKRRFATLLRAVEHGFYNEGIGPRTPVEEVGIEPARAELDWRGHIWKPCAGCTNYTRVGRHPHTGVQQCMVCWQKDGYPPPP